MARRLVLFALLGLCLVLLARVSERYTLQIDLTAQDVHSLSGPAKSALDALREPLEISAFVPERAVQRAQIERLLAPYLAHAARPRLTFIDPIAQPQQTREAGVTRHGELQLRSGPRREVVAAPDRTAIDLALNRLALRGERWIVVLKGHGESPLDDTPGGLARLAAHAQRHGFRMIELDPDHTDELPDNTALLLIAGPQRAYAPPVAGQISRFIDRGGAVMWLTDSPGPVAVTPGVELEVLPGIVVDAAAAAHGLDSPDHAIVGEYPRALLPQPPGAPGIFQQSRGLALSAADGWEEIARLQSSPRSWNETGDLRGRIARDPGLGEQAGPITLAIALEREAAGGRQRLLLVGGRHFIANDQLGQGDNLALAIGLLNWLTDNALVAIPRPAPDLDLHWSPRLGATLAVVSMGLLPLVYLAAGLWLRSRRRRA